MSISEDLVNEITQSPTLDNQASEHIIWSGRPSQIVNTAPIIFGVIMFVVLLLGGIVYLDNLFLG